MNQNFPQQDAFSYNPNMPYQQPFPAQMPQQAPMGIMQNPYQNQMTGPYHYGYPPQNFQQPYPPIQVDPNPNPPAFEIPKQRLVVKLENNERGFYSAMHSQVDPTSSNKIKNREAMDFFQRSGYSEIKQNLFLLLAFSIFLCAHSLILFSIFPDSIFHELYYILKQLRPFYS